ncbi:zinc finger protein 2-like [Ruditapes philippinarum]|uniref:zinc finger protein 2-like n=1 Tax=Ruditapes philippinarum TaxID=129788 RepID=UPI00295AF8A2|nr:zinc finger protein 2-like [Ruditapes philippinarum]
MDSSFDQSADQASYTENPSKYPCRVCDKKFKTAPSRRQHEVRHGPKTEYCVECGKQFFRKSELLRHKQCHSIETKYVCDICGNSFNQRDTLQKHIHSIHDGITFTCNICHKVYSSKSSLNKHTLSHMENEECDLCHKLFKRSYIQEHKKLCSNPVREKIHRCNLCNKSFFEQRYLKEHMNYTHGSQRYSCPMCGAPFQHRKSLLEHKRKCLKTD